MWHVYYVMCVLEICIFSIISFPKQLLELQMLSSRCFFNLEYVIIVSIFNTVHLIKYM